jgi:serine/threonine-protein kinase
VSSVPDSEGQLLAGRYRVGERIGEGGMGAVYRGLDERLRREVAIKLLPPDAVGDAAARERLRREALFGASIQHAGIAHVYDVGETDDGGAYLVMELVKGSSLRALIRSDAWDDRARVAAIVETARALGAAHRAGLVHRDVKPDNVMLRTDGRVVLLDFGIAKPGGGGVDALTLTGRGAFVGTPAYLAPEQAHGRSADSRTDQFALAVTAYEVLARVLPWPTSSGLRMLTAILSDPPPPLQVATDTALSETVRPVLERALAKDPADRFPDIDAFADALAKAGGITTGSLRAPPVPAPSLRSPSASTLTELSRTELLPITTPTGRGARRRRRWALAVAAVSATSLATVLTWRAHRNPLAVADPVLACVVFEGNDHGAPAGWLGAAGASRFCDYAAPALGGMHRHVRFPADLLALPHQPTRDFPEDPYEERDARARSLAEARGRGLAYADGDVDALDDGFRVTVTLHAADGRRFGEATGRGDTLGEAAGAALDALVSQGAVPPREALDPEVNEVFGSRTVREAMVDARLSLELSYRERSPALQRLCAANPVRREGKAGVVWRLACAGPAAEEDPPAREVPHEPPPLSDLGALLAYLEEGPGQLSDAELAAVIDGLDALLPKVVDPSIRAVVKEMQADLSAGRHQDLARWEANDLAAAALDPRMVATAGQGFDMNQIRESDGLGPRTAVAWAPDWDHAWRGRSLSRRREDLGRALDWAERWYVLNPSSGADAYGLAALRAGRGELVLTVAARLAMSNRPGDRDESVLLENLALAARNDIARAYENLRGTLPARDPDAGTFIALGTIRHLALLLGRERELADWVVDHYVAGDRYPLEGKNDGGTGVGKVAALCSSATPEKARRCLATLHDRARSSVFGSVEMVDAAERWVAGDVEGAGQAARRAMRQPWYVKRNGEFLLMVLDAARLYDLADEIDAPFAAERGLFHGEDWFTVLRARRAFARGDRDAGRKLARRIVDAWKLADVPVPAVAEMERELAKP